MSGYTADALYGIDPTAARPTASAIPDHAGSPEPTVDKSAPAKNRLDSPIVAVVVLLGLVVVLSQVSFRGTIAVKA